MNSIFNTLTLCPVLLVAGASVASEDDRQESPVPVISTVFSETGSLRSSSKTLEGHVGNLVREVQRKYGVKIGVVIDGFHDELDSEHVFKIENESYSEILESIADAFGYQFQFSIEKNQIEFSSGRMNAESELKMLKEFWISEEFAQKWKLGSPIDIEDCQNMVENLGVRAEVTRSNDDSMVVSGPGGELLKLEVLMSNP